MGPKSGRTIDLEREARELFALWANISPLTAASRARQWATDLRSLADEIRDERYRAPGCAGGAISDRAKSEDLVRQAALFEGLALAHEAFRAAP
jgi:hypothetical protein